MSDDLKKFMSELCDFLLGHGHTKAADELADELDLEDTRT